MNTHWITLPLFVLLPLFANPATAEIYRWTDANGRVHFANQKPIETPDAQVEAFHGGSRASFVDGGPKAATPGGAKIRMFTTQWCPVCKKAKAYLKKRATPFEELDVEASPSAKAEYERLGGKGVPVILVGEQRLDGFDAGRMEHALSEAGW